MSDERTACGNAAYLSACGAQERERARAAEQQRGALQILDQLAARERERAADAAQRQAEGEEMKRRIEALKREEHEVGRMCVRVGEGRWQ